MNTYCESCKYECCWDYNYNIAVCLYEFKEKEPFQKACKHYIASDSRGDESNKEVKI